MLVDKSLKNLIYIWLQNNNDNKEIYAMELMGIDMELFDSLEENLKILADEAYRISKEIDYATQKWLDNQDVCEILNISYRTLQYYRAKGDISFTQIERKIYYKPEDVEKFLRRSYRKK